ncbi:hypothetical protein ACXN5S_19555 [Pseudoroseicyclus sp. H15]
MSDRGSVQNEIVVALFCVSGIVLQVLFRGWGAVTLAVISIFGTVLIALYVIPITDDAYRSFRNMTSNQKQVVVRHFLPHAVSLLAIVSGLFWVESRVIYSVLDRTLYAIEVDALQSDDPQSIGCASLGGDARLVCRGPMRNTEEDIENAIDRIEFALAAQLQRRITKASGEYQDMGLVAAQDVRSTLWDDEEPAIPRSITGLGLQYDKSIKCSIWSIVWRGGRYRKRCARTIILEPVDSAFIAARNDGLNRYDAEVIRLEALGDTFSLNSAAVLNDYIKGPLAEQFDVVRRTSLVAFRIAHCAAVLALASQLFFIYKALALLYCRLAFNPRVGNQSLPIRDFGSSDCTTFITVEALTSTRVSSTGVRHGFLRPTAASIYLFHGDGILRSREGRLCIPTFWKASFGRILSRKFLAYRYDPGEGAEFGAFGDVNKTVLMIHLPPGVRIAVRLRYLLGFEHGLDFGTRYELNLSNLVRGRMIFSVISGGKFGGSVLMYSPHGTFGKMTPEGDAAPREALVAFDPESTMQIEADLGWSSTWSGEYGLRPLDDSCFCLYSAAAVPSPAARFIRRSIQLLSPTPF